VKKLVRGMGLDSAARRYRRIRAAVQCESRKNSQRSRDSEVLDSNFRSGCSDCGDMQGELIEAIGYRDGKEANQN
jgi:hypothetical protein